MTTLSSTQAFVAAMQKQREDHPAKGAAGDMTAYPEMDGFIFENIQVSDLDITQLVFMNCRFRNCTFINCDLSFCYFIKSNTEQLRFEDCSFHKAAIFESVIFAEFQNCSLTKCAIRDTDMRGCNFSGSDLGYSELTGNDLRNCNWASVKLEGVLMANCKLFNAQKFRFDVSGNDSNVSIPNFVNIDISEEGDGSLLADGDAVIGYLREEGEENSLDLSAEHFDEFPMHISGLTKLRSLNISKSGSMLHNRRMKQLPPAIGQLKELEVLSIRNCSLTTLPDTFGNLKNLRWLDISNNPFEAVPAAIYECDAIRYLAMDGCELEIFPVALSRLAELEELSLEGNFLETIPDLKGFKKLKRLSLSYNEYLGESPAELSEHISSLPAIEYVGLRRIGLKQFPIALLSHPSLKQIDIGENYIPSSETDALAKQTGIKINNSWSRADQD